MISNRTKTGRGGTRRPASVLARLGGVCSLAAVAALAVAAAPAGAFVYTDNQSGGVVQFSGGSSGLLSALSPRIGGVGTQGGPEALSPDGNSLYVANGWIPPSSPWFPESGSSALSQYSVAADGTLSVKAPMQEVNLNPVGAIVASPDGRYLYTVGGGSSTIFVSAIGSGGVLGPLNWAGNAGDDPTGLTVAYGIDGHGVASEWLYVTNRNDGTISQFRIGSSGALTSLSPATVPVGGTGGGDPDPTALAVDEATCSVYVANADGTVWEYSLGPFGALTPKAVPAVATSDGESATAIAVSPNGQYVYVTGEAGDGSSVINQFTAGAGGELAPMSPLALAAGADADGIAVSPDGSTVYVSGSDYIWQYRVGAGGALSSLGAVDAPAQPGGIVAGGPETNLTASHFAPLTLTLTAGVSSTPLAGQTLTFTAGGKSCTTTTNASGQAGACESNISALTSGFEVTYAGDPDYQPTHTRTVPLDELVVPPLCNACEP